MQLPYGRLSFLVLATLSLTSASCAEEALPSRINRGTDSGRDVSTDLGSSDSPLATDSSGIDTGLIDTSVPPSDANPPIDQGVADQGPVDQGLPPTCTTNAQCNNGLACDGVETCHPTLGCQPGPPATCSDGISCTVDSCAEPSGTCSSVAPDADEDGARLLGCAGGTDCNDGNSAVRPGATELCNGLDDNCDGVLDNGAGMLCVLGSNPVACTTACNTAGTRACSASCSLGTCVAASETCSNGCDDDGDGMIDENCSMGSSPPGNDLCAGSTLISGGTGTVQGTLVAATQQSSGCGTAEVYYRITLSARSLVSLDTFGSSLDTAIGYVGTSCGSSTSQCADDSCGSGQSHYVQILNAGTHYFAVSSGSGALGTFQLSWEVIRAAGNLMTLLTTSPSDFTRSLGTGGALGYCGSGGVPSINEDGFYLPLCPGQTINYEVETCDAATTARTVIALFRGTSTTAVMCSEQGTPLCGEVPPARIAGSTSGPGVALFVIDALYPYTGGYQARITF